MGSVLEMRVGGGRMVGAALSEGEATMRVLLAAGGLVLLGAGLAVFTVWWWRSTRPEPSALASLELMSDRKFLAAEHAERERLLHEHSMRSRLAVTSPPPGALEPVGPEAGGVADASHDATVAAPAPQPLAGQ